MDAEGVPVLPVRSRLPAAWRPCGQVMERQIQNVTLTPASMLRPGAGAISRRIDEA
jgi:hypothetical protein